MNNNTSDQDVYKLDGKDYTYLEAMRILMKGQPKTMDNRKQAHSYLMWRCKIVLPTK